MTYQHILLEQSDGVAVVTVNRPDKLNALNDDVLAELASVFGSVRSDTSVSGVIITGAGRAFVAGADIAQLSTQLALDGRARAMAGQAVMRMIECLPKPVIAAVNGFALGGGCELALACHLRVASDAAQFGQPEVKLGITPGFGGTQRLARLVGRANALELLLTGDRISAADALRIGLVNRVVPADALMDECRKLLSRITVNGPNAVALCLEAVDRGLNMALEDGLALEANHFGLLSSTQDMREGMSAFLEKRAANFSGG